MRNSGGSGGEEDNDAADKKRMKALAKANPAYVRSLAQQQCVRAAIAKVTAQELKGTNISVAQAQARQQAQWDANGAAIYAANQQFKETFGKEMDAATKEQAIKDATVNGVFNAGLYSVNLNTAQAKQEAEAEAQRRAEQAAMLEAQRQAKEEAARQQALEDFRAGERNAVEIAEEYQREQAMQSYRAGEQVVIREENNENFLSAIWNASMSAVGSALSPVKNIGELLSANRGGGPPTPWDKFVAWLGEQWGGFVTRWNELWQWEKQSTPKATPTVDSTVIAAIQSAQTQVSATQTAQVMPTASPTVTPTLAPTSMWVTYSAPFHSDNPYDKAEFVIPVGSVVIPTGKTQPAIIDGKNVVYKEVIFDGKHGWVLLNYLEGVINSSSSLTIDPSKKVIINPALSYVNTALPNPADTPAQYLSLDNLALLDGVIKPGGNIKTNLCGSFAVAYVTGRSIETVLSDWITKFPAARSNIVDNDTTGISDIRDMLDLYQCKYNEDIFLDTIFLDKTAPYNPIIISPGRIQEQLDLGQVLILGVGIDGSGTINGGDTTHWVVVEKVEPQGSGGGSVLLQNSMPNEQQSVSYDQLKEAWDTFITANGGFSGSPPMGIFVDPNTCTPP